MFPYGYGYPWGPMAKEDEVRMLEDQAKLLQDQLEEVNRRLGELKK
jgi:prefoldin subunit 5